MIRLISGKYPMREKLVKSKNDALPLCSVYIPVEGRAGSVI